MILHTTTEKQATYVYACRVAGALGQRIPVGPEPLPTLYPADVPPFDEGRVAWHEAAIDGFLAWWRAGRAYAPPMDITAGNLEGVFVGPQEVFEACHIAARRAAGGIAHGVIETIPTRAASIWATMDKQGARTPYRNEYLGEQDLPQLTYAFYEMVKHKLNKGEPK